MLKQVRGSVNEYEDTLVKRRAILFRWGRRGGGISRGTLRYPQSHSQGSIDGRARNGMFALASVMETEGRGVHVVIASLGWCLRPLPSLSF